MSDDDLPVLTHVLRTGSVPVAGPGGSMAVAPAPTAPPALDDDPDDVFGVEPPASPASEPSIDFGHGHRAMPSAVDAPPAATPLARSDIVADPRQKRRREAFGPFADDDDLEFPGTMDPIDEPELIATVSDRHRQGTPISLDTPLDFSVPPDTAALARSIRQAVLDDLAGRIDVELDARIAQAMRTEIETALSQLQGNLRHHLTEALRDVVARAVDAEIARMTWSAASGLPH